MSGHPKGPVWAPSQVHLIQDLKELDHGHARLLPRHRRRCAVAAAARLPALLVDCDDTDRHAAGWAARWLSRLPRTRPRQPATSADAEREPDVGQLASTTTTPEAEPARPLGLAKKELPVGERDNQIALAGGTSAPAEDEPKASATVSGMAAADASIDGRMRLLESVAAPSPVLDQVGIMTQPLTTSELPSPLQPTGDEFTKFHRESRQGGQGGAGFDLLHRCRYGVLLLCAQCARARAMCRSPTRCASRRWSTISPMTTPGRTAPRPRSRQPCGSIRRRGTRKTELLQIGIKGYVPPAEHKPRIWRS